MICPDQLEHHPPPYQEALKSFKKHLPWARAVSVLRALVLLLAAQAGHTVAHPPKLPATELPVGSRSAAVGRFAPGGCSPASGPCASSEALALALKASKSAWRRLWRKPKASKDCSANCWMSCTALHAVWRAPSLDVPSDRGARCLDCALVEACAEHLKGDCYVA